MIVNGNWSRALKIYLTPPQIVIACLGFASAVPLVLVLSVLFIWFARAGIVRVRVAEALSHRHILLQH